MRIEGILGRQHGRGYHDADEDDVPENTVVAHVVAENTKSVGRREYEEGRGVRYRDDLGAHVELGHSSGPRANLVLQVVLWDFRVILLALHVLLLGQVYPHLASAILAFLRAENDENVR